MKGYPGICNRARTRNVCENNQPTNPNERDEPKPTGRKLRETAGPSKSTKKQSNFAHQCILHAYLPQLLLQLGTKGPDKNKDNDKDERNEPAEDDDETDSIESSYFGYAV